MTKAYSSTANQLMKDMASPVLRTGQPMPVDASVLEDFIIVSADGHVEITEDIFYENFPSQLRAEAPRVWHDKYWHIGYREGMQNYPSNPRVDEAARRTVLNGWDMDTRLAHMDTEGVRKEIVFPHSLISFARYPKLEVQEHMYRVYNDYIAQWQAKAPGRFYGVGVFSNWWDPARAEAAMQQIVDLGLKTFMVPVNPGKNVVGGETISYADPVMDRFWDVVDEAGLPLNFHVGEAVGFEHRGGLGAMILVSISPFRKPLGELIFGGVFDRHPDVKVVFSEGGIAWVPPALQDAEMLYDTYGSGQLLDEIKLRPSDYWHRNCYATFQNDLLGLEQLDYIGADRAMWGADYPHLEGSYGFGWQSRQSVIEAIAPEKARRILGGTAMDLYHLRDD